jgi:hypothetical protein
MIEQLSRASADARLATIARLNDRCRQGLDRTARIMMTRACLGTFTSGDDAMSIVVQARLYAAIRNHVFADADAAERDRGNFEFEGTTVYFKIDYYDTALDYGSEDPADASITRRVLTIMVREDV